MISFSAVSGGRAAWDEPSVWGSGLGAVCTSNEPMLEPAVAYAIIIWAALIIIRRRNEIRITGTRVFYGWIWSVQRNCHVAMALIATETTKSEISGTEIFGGPLPVSRRNIQGSKIMA